MTYFFKFITAAFPAGALSGAQQGSSLMMGYLGASIYDKQREYKHKITFQIYLFLN